MHPSTHRDVMSRDSVPDSQVVISGRLPVTGKRCQKRTPPAGLSHTHTPHTLTGLNHTYTGTNFQTNLTQTYHTHTHQGTELLG